MDKLKKIIIILLILMIIIATIIIVAVALIKNSQDDSYYQDTEFEHDVSNENLQSTIVDVTNRNEYYAVRNIIGKYAYAIIEGGNQSVYNMLNNDYVKENNINTNNVKEVVEKIKLENLSEDQLSNYKLTTNIDKMLYIQSEVNIKTFFVYGKFSNNVNSEKIDFKIIVQLDSKNGTFYIFPTSYTEKKYSNEEDINNYSTNLEQIEKNQYNTFSFVNISDTTIINDYIASYKNSLLNLNEESYNFLDEEYKKRKFNNFNEYKEYVTKHLKELLSINITKYKKEEKDNKIEYICLSNNGNYYILNETAIMKFSIMLDTYTIPLSDFKAKYDKLDNNKKVAMNIEKVVQALNLKDIQYIYNKLDDTFKMNNFPTINDFENYININYPSTYDIEYSNYSEENGIYMQDIILKDKNSNTQKENSIIMQLKDNYEFVMSFNVE